MDNSGESTENAAGRSEDGRFRPGHQKLGGRRPGQSISAEIRRIVDPEAIARFLDDLVHNTKAPYRERLQAADMILNRLEGRPVARSIQLRASSVLPPGWDDMLPEQRDRALDDIRQRALNGTFQGALDE